ncbi:MAG: DUF790 family protein [Planctomycetota bacterium]|nr:DUF790 family protein [Planctomycetota bacterium]
MLTRHLLRYSVHEGRVEPRWWRDSPGQRALAQQLLDLWRAQVGQTQAAVLEQAEAIVQGARHPLIVRPLIKVLDDACTYQQPAERSAARARVFDASVAALRRPRPTLEEHAAAVAQALAEPLHELRRELYRDLPEHAQLAAVPPWSAQRLLAEANLALAQGLLLYAEELSVTVEDADCGRQRRLLRALSWRRLLARARREGEALQLTISGPAAVLQQAKRYGLQLAQWLPALCGMRRWQLTARLRLPGQPAEHALSLTSAGLWPARASTCEWVPPELTNWLEELAPRLTGWRVIEADPLLLPGGELIIPDLWLADPQGAVAVELFHRWHAARLPARLQQLRAGQLPSYVCGIERALTRLAALRSCLDDPLLAARSFRFSELPSARALSEALQRLRQGALLAP